MTAMLEDETITGVDEKTRRSLEAAADIYTRAPAQLRTAILKAARRGDKPAAIARAIGYVYTYDYVARLVRNDRRAHPELYARS